MVVIFKPASEIRGKTPEDVVEFKDDALDFFRKNDIPIANVFDDLELSADDYGSGDHYNSSGRRKVTDFVSESYRQELEDG
jgi:hypothetical protein